jgi:hypothetical protein
VSDHRDDFPEQRATSGKAVASLILGLFSLCLFLITGIPAIILGILGLRDIGRSEGRVTGQGLAIAGLVLGGLGLLLSAVVPFLLIGLLLPAVSKVREAAASAQSQNNLKMIGLALHAHNDTLGELPPVAVYDRTGKPLYSWRVLLLPYLDEGALYQQFHLNEAWDSPHNRQFLARIPKMYQTPGAPPNEEGLTFYQVFIGPETPFPTPQTQGLQPYPRLGFGLDLRAPPRSRIPGSFPDGTSNTFAVVEAADPVPWTKPADLVYDSKGPFPRLGGASSASFNVLFFDGSTRRVRKTANEQLLRAYVTPAGGEMIMEELP